MNHRIRFCLATLLATFAASCAATDNTLQLASARAQLFDQMGAHQREITTNSPEAQEFFNQGLSWMYAFNHDEAIRCFSRVAMLDPDCAMAWWGLGLCHGPNYNDHEMTDERSAAAWAATREALARIENASNCEATLIAALSHRYASPWPDDRSELEQAYADAMSRVWARFPEDDDVGTLYAEALMVQRPWQLYSLAGDPEGDTPLIVETLETVMELNPDNPGANHLYIHALEPSLHPELAIPAADRLCAQVPAAGHLNHMPSHIYIQVGMWDKSIAQNTLAMKADERYVELSPEQGIQHMYMVHNAHMLAFSAMMVGREAEAMAAARAMWTGVPPPVLEMVAPYLDLWMTSVYDVQKRFGRWEDILAEPEPPKFLPVTKAVWHAHRAIAFAAQKRFGPTRQEFEAFKEAKAAIPEESVFGSDATHRILEVCELFVPAEIALQQGDFERAIELLKQAIVVEDSLSYGEPPQWLQPTRHTLGAVYLETKQYEEAERVYRADLAKWPDNGWSLLGLARALEGQGRTAEANVVLQKQRAAWARADEPVHTSCKCLPGTLR